MARLSKQKGVKMLVVQSPSNNIRHVLFSYGSRLKKERVHHRHHPTGDVVWASWKRWRMHDPWKMGHYKEVKQRYVDDGWTIVWEMS